MSDKKHTEQDLLLDHEYDGIQEFDNRLPNWWLYILYGTIIFAVVYWLYFQTTGAGALPHESYQASMAEAAEKQLEAMADQPVTEESLNLVSTVPDRVQAGAEVFKTFCVICHLDQGQGSVGPNLTDAYWLHGGSAMDILRVVTEGVPEKGMAAWGGQLGPKRVQDVTAFVLTLRNTNVAGKEPQGELVGEESGAEN